MDWEGESFGDGDGEWPAPGGGMDFDPWGGGPVADRDQRRSPRERSRESEREPQRERDRSRERERSPDDLNDRAGRPDWKRHQRPADHDYDTQIDLMCVLP